MLGNLFPKFDDNPDIGCDKIDKNLDEMLIKILDYNEM